MSGHYAVWQMYKVRQESATSNLKAFRHTYVGRPNKNIVYYNDVSARCWIDFLAWRVDIKREFGTCSTRLIRVETACRRNGRIQSLIPTAQASASEIKADK